jgi:arylsulfatase A-like enzyme
LILTDDLGWRDLSCYGSTFYETPNIDRLASQGMRFTDTYAAANLCSPIRSALLTGKTPVRLHLTDFLSGLHFSHAALTPPDWTPWHLPHEEITLAEMLKMGGYENRSVSRGTAIFRCPDNTALTSLPCSTTQNV